MIGGQRVEAGGEGCAAEVGELLGVEFYRQAKALRDCEHTFDLGGREGDAFAEAVHGIDQALGMGGVQGGDGDFVDIGVGAVFVFGRDGVGGKVAGFDGDLAQGGDFAGGAQHPQFGVSASRP